METNKTFTDSIFDESIFAKHTNVSKNFRNHFSCSTKEPKIILIEHLAVISPL